MNLKWFWKVFYADKIILIHAVEMQLIWKGDQKR